MAKPPLKDAPGLKQAILIVGVLNLLYFGVEFAGANREQSVSLFADSIDFLEDGFLNFLILLGLGWGARAKARLGMVLALIVVLPSVFAAWSAIQRLMMPVVPGAEGMGLIGLGALAVNLFCALYLMRFRDHTGSLVSAAFFSARNDAIANIGIIGAGAWTSMQPSHWPDLLVGLGILYINASAAWKVYSRSRMEMVEAKASIEVTP